MYPEPFAGNIAYSVKRQRACLEISFDGIMRAALVIIPGNER